MWRTRSDRPIETTISATFPVRRRRRGRKRPRSRPAPISPARARAGTMANSRGRPGPAAEALKYQATTAPKVTSSPWAKLTRPVTPKISERPTEARATMAP